MRHFAAGCLALLLIGCFSRVAEAHPAPFSYVDLRIDGPAMEVAIVVHVLDVAHDLGIADAAAIDVSSWRSRHAAIVGLVRSRLQFSIDGREPPSGQWGEIEALPDRDALRVTARYSLSGPPGRLLLSAWMFPYDPVHQTFVNVYERGVLTLQAILTRDRQQMEYFAGTRQGRAAVVRRFVASGVHHILIGPDHLLFLVGLLLLGGSLRRLALVVSAFTLAHSVTLSLAALAIVSPPPWIVEPAIALSIVYVGADNLTVRGGRDMRAWIAFAFGLIHGFGFANVLREMELPPRALGWSLLSFNVGVEVGQLVVVLVVASTLAAIRARSERAGRHLVLGGSVIVIAAGAFWFIQRVFFA